MDNPEFIEVSQKEGIYIITLKHSQSLSIKGKAELLSAIQNAAKDPEGRVLIVLQGHPEAFLVKISELVEMTPAEAAVYSRAGQQITLAIADLPFPCIAAVDGMALGGGCELAMSCDLTYASTISQFGQIEVHGGVIPAFGGTWNLAQRIGLQRASELIFTGAVMNAVRAKELGLILEIQESANLLPYVLDIARQIKSAASLSVRHTKRILREGYSAPLTTALAMELGAFASLFGTTDQRSRMQGFLEKENKENRMPEETQNAVLPIQTGNPSLTFINMWTTKDKTQQEQLISAMKLDAPEIQKQKGFEGMVFYCSKDGRQLVVYAQWKTKEDFNKGIEQNAAMLAAREKLSQFGTPSASTYLTDSVYLPL